MQRQARHTKWTDTGSYRSLYMAIMSAMKCNPVIKATYQRQLDAGKPRKWRLLPASERWL